jgi:hypothetical protein
MRYNRKWIKHWRVQLMALKETIDYDKPEGDLKEIEGLDQALLETGIQSMLHYMSAEDIAAIMKEVIGDIVASENDQRHWRNREDHEIGRMLHEDIGLIQAKPPSDGWH